MSMTFGLGGAAVLIALGFIAYRFKKTAEPEATPEVVRVTRKNRAKQGQDAAPS